MKGEYFLADAINIMVERGIENAHAKRLTSGWMWVRSRPYWKPTGTCWGTGTITAMSINRKNVKIMPPVFIHASAEVDNSTIGPNVSIGADCKITDSRVEDSILEAGVVVDAAALKSSFIGRQARIQGRSAEIHLHGGEYR